MRRASGRACTKNYWTRSQNKKKLAILVEESNGRHDPGCSTRGQLSSKAEEEIQAVRIGSNKQKEAISPCYGFSHGEKHQMVHGQRHSIKRRRLDGIVLHPNNCFGFEGLPQTGGFFWPGTPAESNRSDMYHCPRASVAKPEKEEASESDEDDYAVYHGNTLSNDPRRNLWGFTGNTHPAFVRSWSHFLCKHPTSTASCLLPKENFDSSDNEERPLVIDQEACLTDNDSSLLQEQQTHSRTASFLSQGQQTYSRTASRSCHQSSAFRETEVEKQRASLLALCDHDYSSRSQDHTLMTGNDARCQERTTANIASQQLSRATDCCCLATINSHRTSTGIEEEGTYERKGQQTITVVEDQVSNSVRGSLGHYRELLEEDERSSQPMLPRATPELQQSSDTTCVLESIQEKKTVAPCSREDHKNDPMTAGSSNNQFSDKLLEQLSMAAIANLLSKGYLSTEGVPRDIQYLILLQQYQHCLKFASQENALLQTLSTQSPTDNRPLSTNGQGFEKDADFVERMVAIAQIEGMTP